MICGAIYSGYTPVLFTSGALLGIEARTDENILYDHRNRSRVMRVSRWNQSLRNWDLPVLACIWDFCLTVLTVCKPPASKMLKMNQLRILVFTEWRSSLLTPSWRAALHLCQSWLKPEREEARALCVCESHSESRLQDSSELNGACFRCREETCRSTVFQSCCLQEWDHIKRVCVGWLTLGCPCFCLYCDKIMGLLLFYNQT